MPVSALCAAPGSLPHYTLVFLHRELGMSRAACPRNRARRCDGECRCTASQPVKTIRPAPSTRTHNAATRRWNSAPESPLEGL